MTDDDDEDDNDGDFIIKTRYPEGAPGEVPTLQVAKVQFVIFSCKTTEPWQTCLWERPGTDERCGIFSDDRQKSCRGWGSDNIGNEWIARQVSPYNCTLSGLIKDGLIHDEDEGEWSCEMRSKPILGGIYKYDQQFFNLELVQEAPSGSETSEEVEILQKIHNITTEYFA